MREFLFVLVVFFLFPALVFSESSGIDDDKFLGWKTAETEHFNFIYEEGARDSAAAFAEIADDAWNKVAGVYGFPKCPYIFCSCRNHDVYNTSYYG